MSWFKNLPNLSATQWVELADISLWHFFWFFIFLLIVMAVADLYHARNNELK